eukprot:3339140-Rhodomonas_salina.1
MLISRLFLERLPFFFAPNLGRGWYQASEEAPWGAGVRSHVETLQCDAGAEGEREEGRGGGRGGGRERESRGTWRSCRAMLAQ